MNFQPGTRQPGGKFRRTATVEANAFERGRLGNQGIKIVGFPGADVGIERAGPYAGAINVPDADMVRQNAPEAFGVRHLVKRFGENCAKQPPEVVLPVPVILLRSQ